MNVQRLLFLALAILAGPAFAAQGDLDPAFGDHGRARLELEPQTTDFGRLPLARQADGRILLAGRDSGGRTQVARRLADGSADGSFGAGGLVTLSFGGGTDFQIRDIVVASDGRIVLAGEFQISGGAKRHMGVVRLLQDGSLDPGFAQAGSADLQLPGATVHSAHAAIVQPDGSIVLAGASDADPSAAFTFVRLLPDGTLDSTFGQSGVSLVAGLFGERSSTLLRQADGKFIACGTPTGTKGGDQMRVVRLNSDGTPDESFGLHGVADAAVGLGLDCALRPDGRIVVTGLQEAIGFVRIAQLMPGGALDPGFGGGQGTVDLTLVCGPAQPCDTAWSNDYADDVALLDDGRIVLAVAAGDCRLGAVRLQADGTPDSTFGPGGVRYVEVGWGDSLGCTDAAGLATGESGRLLVAENGTGWPTLARLNLDDAPGATLVSTTFEFNVEETDQDVLVHVRRSGSAEGAVSVDFSTVDGTALAGSDYQTVSGTLTWADGDTEDKTVAVRILDDGKQEPREDFAVKLSNPAGTGIATGVAWIHINASDGGPSPSDGNTSGSGNGGGGGGAAGPGLLGLLALLWLARRRSPGGAFRRQPLVARCPP